MPIHVALLRGINVGGHKKIRMADLRGLCESLGLDDVATYVQSGNVVFRAPRASSQALARRIGGGIEDEYGFSVTVLVRTSAELRSVLKKNPFAGRRGVDASKLLVTFLSAAPRPDAVKRLAQLDAGADEWKLAGREVYLHCPGGYGRTKLSSTVLERRLAVESTTRNWKTVNALVEMCG